MKCINCNHNYLIKIVKIGNQPLSGFFYSKKKVNLKKYSLDLYECPKCKLVQLNNKVDVKIMYGKHYGYETSVSNLMISHLNNKIKRFKNLKFIKPGSKILDIGSNDGTFLKLLGKKYKLFGIDPSAKKFKKNYYGMNLINNFFSKKKILKSLDKKDQSFDLITSFAIFYDVDAPNKFCEDINSLLSDNGIWVCEFSYLPLMLKNLTFDQICHEHLAYYSLTVFESILKKNNLRVIDLKLNEINGGSIEVLVSKKNSSRRSNIKFINKIKQDEKKITKKSYFNFQKRITNSMSKLKKFVDINKPIVAYGASTKGNIILNYCKFSNHEISYVCDANPKKYNKFTPGSNLKIVPKSKIIEFNPKNILVLIWSFRSEIIRQEKDFINKGGNLIFHLPKFHIINKKNFKEYLSKNFNNFSYNY